MDASRVGGELCASVSECVCVCLCVCVCTCVLTYGRGWCGRYREEEEGLFVSVLQTLPKCSVLGVCRDAFPPLPSSYCCPPALHSSSSDRQDRGPQAAPGLWCCVAALVSFPKWGVIADDAHVEQCQNQLYFT